MNLFCKKQNMQQQKYNPWTYNTETTIDITITLVSTDYAENPKPVLQETKYAATEIQPWTYITEKSTDITLSPPGRTDYAKNPEIVLQKIEYAAAEIHPCTYITKTVTNITLSPPCKHRLCRKS